MLNKEILREVSKKAILVTGAVLATAPSIASAQESSNFDVVKDYWDVCGGGPGLETLNPKIDYMVVRVFNKITGTFEDKITIWDDQPGNDCDQNPVAPAASAPASFDCVLEVPLGTASGNGAVVNEYVATQRVILHGDMEINGEFRADSNGTTGLIQDVNASPSNPARIRTINPAWGGDVAAFCRPEDMAANIQQGVDNLRSQGMRADVLPWPGPKQGVATSTYVAPIAAPVAVAPAPSSSTEGCARVDVQLGTAKGASTNEVTVTQYVIAHGDVSINGERRYDDNGATGLVQRVHASVSNPARITANPAWGGQVVSFCNEDNEANVQQAVAGLQAQGIKADVRDWPGAKQ